MAAWHMIRVCILIRIVYNCAVPRIEYSRDAARTLLRIDTATARRIRDKILLLATDPASLANNIKALRGSEGLMRLRVGDWRVIYTVDLVVLQVVRVAPRGSAYD